MNARKLIMTATLLALLIGMFAMNGCNTWKGMGKDVEKTGDAMQGD